MRIKHYFAILVIFLTISLSARPIRPGRYTMTQPDGTTFAAVCLGDEFMKIIKTLDGHAIIKDNDGWWCYAIYNTDGSRQSSGYRVGVNAPSDVLSKSLDIPYTVLSENAAAKRSAFHREEENILKRTMRAQGIRLMSERETVIKKHGLVILAQYKDVKFKKDHGKAEFTDLLTKEGYNENGATGSAKDYFDSQFEGMFKFEFEVSDIVTLSENRAYYGQNNEYGDDSRPAEMVKEACCLAHDKGINFSKYDDDSDGYVDNVFVLFAGEDEADNQDKYADCIWSHSWYVKSGAGITLELDGKIIDQYACTSEIMAGGQLTGIGTFCHEFAHTLGLPDMYDTDYDESGGWAAALWSSTSLMDGGNSNNNCHTPPYFNAIERELLGLSKPLTLEHNGSYTLTPIHENGLYYKIQSDTDNEYYLLESRAKDGWDSYIGGTGMLVYHVDKSKREVWAKNAINTNPRRQYVDLVEADDRNDVLTESNYAQLRNISGVFFPYANVTSFTPESTPRIWFWNGSEVKTSITDIERSGDNITFTVSGLKGEIPPTPTNLKVDTFMDAAILSFESNRPFDGEANIAWGRADQETEEISISPYETGKYAIILEGLTPGNKTYTASIWFETDGVKSQSKKTSFMTTKTAPVNWPYIYLGKKSNDDGTFSPGTKIPLRVYNAHGAEEIEWEFNGEDIIPAGDGYFAIEEGGVLRATVYWEEGGTDTLEQHIILSE